jgi:hypothetical protein
VEIFDEYITPAELTGYAREALADRADNEFQLARWLPNNTINDLEFRFSRGGGGLTEAANYRAYDAEPDFGRREGISRVTGELPPIARQMFLDEYSQLRLRGNIRQEMRDLLLRDAERLTRQIGARLELARGDALVNGSVTIDENGVQATVDFNRSATHEVAPAVLWSDHVNATVLDDLEAWMQVYSDTNGTPPGAILTSTAVARHIARNAQIQAELYPNNPGRRVTRAMIDDYLAEMRLPPIITYDARISRGGTATRVVPEDRFLFLPQRGDANDPETGELGTTLWGTTLESMEPGYGIEDGAWPGIVSAAHKSTTTPVQVVTIASAIGVPIMANPDLTLVADVI